MIGALDLRFRLSRSRDGSLEILYRVKNETPRTVFLTTPLVRIGLDEARPRTSLVYTFLDLAGVLQITKRLWPVPVGLDVFSPEVPLLTEVRPWTVFDEVSRVPLPIQVTYPYRADTIGSSEAPVRSRGVMFSVGYFVEGEQGLSRTAARKTREGYAADYDVLAGRQQLLMGGRAPAQLPVSVRRDEIRGEGR